MDERRLESIGGVLRGVKRSALYTVCVGSEVPVSVHRMLRRMLGRGPRLLLVSQSRLMSEYVLRVWDTVSDVPGVEGWFLSSGDDVSIDASHLGLYPISAGRAAVQWWDAIILADHEPLKFAPSIPRVAVSHGLARSRNVAQGSYFYDRSRVFWPDQRLVYSIVLSTSEGSRDWALGIVPEYRDRIRVVGDLRVDEMLEFAKDSDGCRDKLGISQDRTVVLVMSTWGPHGLMPRIGRDLILEMERLGPTGYHFVVTMHPNLWSGPRSDVQLRDSLLKAEGDHISVIRPDEDWAPYLAASDVCLTDHTSLAATYAVLDKPIVALTVEDGIVGADTFAALVLDYQPRLAAVSELEKRLREALDRGSLAPEVAATASRVVSHRHEAARMTRETLLGLIDVDDPQHSTSQQPP